MKILILLILIPLPLFANRPPFRSDMTCSSPYLSETGKGGERRNNLHVGYDCHPKWGLEKDKDWIIFPIMDGKVIRVDYNDIDGKYVLMRTPAGLYVKYSHADIIYDYYQVGDFLTTDNYIMLMGKTGYTDGYHLHLEVYEIVDGKKVNYDPEKYFNDEPVREIGGQNGL